MYPRNSNAYLVEIIKKAQDQMELGNYASARDYIFEAYECTQNQDYLQIMQDLSALQADRTSPVFNNWLARVNAALDHMRAVHVYPANKAPHVTSMPFTLYNTATQQPSVTNTNQAAPHSNSNESILTRDDDISFIF